MKPDSGKATDPRTGSRQSALDRRASNLHQTNAATGLSTPVEEFIDSDGQFVVRMDLPGMRPHDIDSKARQGKLVIKGRRRRNREALGEDLVRSEVVYGRFRRSLPLPSWVRTGNVEVQYEHGVLELRLETDPASCPGGKCLIPREEEVLAIGSKKGN